MNGEKRMKPQRICLNCFATFNLQKELFSDDFIHITFLVSEH